MIYGSDRKKGRIWPNKVISEKKKKMVMKQGRKKVEVGTLLLGNDKNNVIVNKVLSYFECLSFKFEVHVACLGTTVNNNY